MGLKLPLNTHDGCGNLAAEPLTPPATRLDVGRHRIGFFRPAPTAWRGSDGHVRAQTHLSRRRLAHRRPLEFIDLVAQPRRQLEVLVLGRLEDRKSTRLNSSHPSISYAV